MKKTLLVLLVVVFVLALATPAFATGSMTHNGYVKGDGEIIRWDKQAGHLCNTGAQAVKRSRGVGVMDNEFSITMVKGKLTVVDNHDFVSRAGTTNPMYVSTLIKLCTPPKYTYTGWQLDLHDPMTPKVKGFKVTAPVAPQAIYVPGGVSMPRSWTQNGWVGVDYRDRAKAGAWEALTLQVWYAKVQADPGALGTLKQNFEAAYGPYKGGAGVASAEDVSPSNTWAWNLTGTAPVPGTTFVGDYFKMTQTASTPSGKVDRYISISTPWSGSYLHEDMEFKGLVEVVESFNLVNIGAGVDTPRLPWKVSLAKR